MKKQLAELAERRHCLLKEVNTQRLALTIVCIRLQKPLAVLDTGLEAVKFIRKHPAWMASAAAAILVLKHKGIFGFIKTGGHLLYLYPSAILLGSQYLISKIHSFKNKPASKEIIR